MIMMASCTDDTVSPTPVPQQQEEEEQELSTLQKLAQEWVLEETFENGIQKTSNGDGLYLFSEDGAFFFYANGSWNAIGSYAFEGSDSTRISVLFTGVNTPVMMDLTTLTETELQTEFCQWRKYVKTINYTR